MDAIEASQKQLEEAALMNIQDSPMTLVGLFMAMMRNAGMEPKK